VESESIVYGCIRDWPSADPEQCRQRRANNLAAVQALPQGEAWPFIGREMFSFCRNEELGLYQTQVIHFGASYRAVEYEWALWVQRFEEPAHALCLGARERSVRLKRAAAFSPATRAAHRA